MCDSTSKEIATTSPPDDRNVSLATSAGDDLAAGKKGKESESYVFFSPKLLKRLSVVSMCLLGLIGLLSVAITILFAYACASLVMKGIRHSGSGKVLPDDLDESKLDCHSRCDRNCHRFWMRAILVDEDEMEEEEESIKDKNKEVDVETEETNSLLLTSVTTVSNNRYPHNLRLGLSVSIYAGNTCVEKIYF